MEQCRWAGTGRRWSCKRGTGCAAPRWATHSAWAWRGWDSRTSPPTPAGPRTPSRGRSSPHFKYQVRNSSNCSNWDPKCLLNAGLQIPKKTRYGLTHRSLWSPCLKKCLKLGPKSVSVRKNLFRICFVSCILNFYTRFLTTNHLPTGSMCNCVPFHQHFKFFLKFLKIFSPQSALLVYLSKM